jgi:hypothetical protein|tara:strand:+ start:3071 stop:3658 length:588 start_codon:yes stop_codon:yes gene_type:complete
MRPLYHFIIELPKKFNDEIELAGNTIKLLTKFDEFNNRVNYGKIVAAPKALEGKSLEGQWLYFHHHVVMEQMYDIGDNLYLVNYEADGGYQNHAIAIENQDGDITMLGDWCFVLPEDEREEETSPSGIILSLVQEFKLEGLLLAIPEDSKWIGAKSGDMVGYTKDSEYEMDLINGTKVFRMRDTELVYVKETKEI